MNHLRKQIRNQLVQLLATGGTLAGSRVHGTLYRPRTAFPALVVLTVGEDQSLLSDIGGPDRAVMRTVHVDVQAEVQQLSGCEDIRDDLLAEVEALMALAAIPGVRDIVPVAMRAETDQQGDRPITVGRQRFAVTVITTQADPSAAA